MKAILPDGTMQELTHPIRSSPMSEQTLSALRSVLGYIWDDERKNFDSWVEELEEEVRAAGESRAEFRQQRKAHIFYSMMVLAKWSAMHPCVVDEDIPFDQGSIFERADDGEEGEEADATPE